MPDAVAGPRQGVADAEVGFGAGLPRPARTSRGADAGRGPGLQSGDLVAATEPSPARLMPGPRGLRNLPQPAIVPHRHPLPFGRAQFYWRPRGSGRVLEGPGGVTGLPRCSFRGGRCVAGSPTDMGTAPCPFHVLPEGGGSPRCLQHRSATGRHRGNELEELADRAGGSAVTGSDTCEVQPAMTDSSHSPRSRAAHSEDHSACDGPPDAVRVRDAASATGTIEKLHTTVPSDPLATRRMDRLRHAVSITRWRVDGMTRDRLLLLASGRLPACERDLVLIADAAGVTVDWLLHD